MEVVDAIAKYDYITPTIFPLKLIIKKEDFPIFL